MIAQIVCQPLGVSSICEIIYENTILKIGRDNSIIFVAAIFEVASHMGSASSVKEAEKFPEQCFSDNYFRINLARMFRDSEIAGGRRVLGLQANNLPRVG